MNEFPFHTFIKLVQFDRSLAEHEDQANLQERELDALQLQLQAYDAGYEQRKAAEHAAQKAVDLKELEVKALDERSAKIRFKLENVANPKEYSSLTKELHHLQNEQQDLEVSLLDAWNNLEQTKRELARAHTLYEQERNALLQQIQELEQRIAAQDSAIDQLYEQREQQMTGIPEEWLQKYDTMRHRIEDPVVPMHNKSCSGCAYILSEQEVNRLAHRALLQCKHCFRFLYDPACVDVA